MPTVRDRVVPRVAWLNLAPSAKGLARERETLRPRTGPEQGHTPWPELTKTIHRRLRGWGKHFSLGSPRTAYRQIHAQVRPRLTYHLQRRSQRGYRPPEGQSFDEHLHRMGLIYLGRPAATDGLRAGGGKTARPVRRGEGSGGHGPSGLFIPCFPSLLY